MIDLPVPIWIGIFVLGVPMIILLMTHMNPEYQNVVRVSGLTTTIAGGVIVLVAMPFMSFGERSYLVQDERGEWVQQSDSSRLLDTASTEALIVITGSLLIPVLLIGLISTRIIPKYPRLSVGLLWALAVWLLGWLVPLMLSVAWIVTPIPLMAIFTAIFGTLAFREQKEQQLHELRRNRVRSS